MSDAIPLPARPDLDQYKKLAKDFQHACRSGDSDAIRTWAASWLTTLAGLRGLEAAPDLQEKIDREVSRIERRWRELKLPEDRKAACGLTDAQFFLAREHGFASWPKFAEHVETLTQKDSPVSAFESAADAIAGGDIERLRTLLREHPKLIRARSTRDHHSTLLHYVSANGIEDFRQRTPKNIVEITALLLNAGADVNAESGAYGGGSTTLGLVATSIHPEQAGVQIALLELLIAHGAEIEKPGLTGNSSSAVRGCLANGQGEAATFFANRGAHMDLEEAAGVGHLELVKSFFDEKGALKPPATKEQLESGFLYAAGYGHTDMVRFLLEKGVDPGVHNEQGQTGLHWTSHGPHIEVAKLLLAARPSLVHVIERAFNGTPLDWALHAWANTRDAAERERADELVALLRQAGAKSNLTPP